MGALSHGVVYVVGGAFNSVMVPPPLRSGVGVCSAFINSGVQSFRGRVLKICDITHMIGIDLTSTSLLRFWNFSAHLVGVRFSERFYSTRISVASEVLLGPW